MPTQKPSRRRQVGWCVAALASLGWRVATTGVQDGRGDLPQSLYSVSPLPPLVPFVPIPSLHDTSENASSEGLKGSVIPGAGSHSSRGSSSTSENADGSIDGADEHWREGDFPQGGHFSTVPADPGMPGPGVRSSRASQHENIVEGGQSHRTGFSQHNKTPVAGTPNGSTSDDGDVGFQEHRRQAVGLQGNATVAAPLGQGSPNRFGQSQDVRAGKHRPQDVVSPGHNTSAEADYAGIASVGSRRINMRQHEDAGAQEHRHQDRSIAAAAPPFPYRGANIKLMRSESPGDQLPMSNALRNGEQSPNLKAHSPPKRRNGVVAHALKEPTSPAWQDGADNRASMPNYPVESAHRVSHGHRSTEERYTDVFDGYEPSIQEDGRAWTEDQESDEATDIVEVGHGRPLKSAAPPWEKTLLREERELRKARMEPASESGGEIARLLGEGVGADTYDSTSPRRSRSLNHEMRRRLQIQDKATFIVLVAVFYITVAATLLAVYRAADDKSPIVFYTDPKSNRQRVCCTGDDLETFCSVFVHNQPPAVTRLRILGKHPRRPQLGVLLGNFHFRQAAEHVHKSVVESLQRTLLPNRHRLHASDRDVIFDVSLDLTPFVVGSPGAQNADSNVMALGEQDAKVLQEHLRTPNPLQVLMLRKRVQWEGWEDMATNIRQRLRTLGFDGDVDVLLDASEEMVVFRNDQWQNFVRNWITTALVCMLVFGPFLWLPYIWTKRKTVQIHAQYHISLDLQRYWDLLAEGLHGSVGFEAH